MCEFLESGGSCTGELGVRISIIWRLLGSSVCVFLESGSSWEAGCAYFSSLAALVILDVRISQVWKVLGG